MIPVFRPEVKESGIEAIKEVIDSHWLGMGPKVDEFENKFARYIGTSYCVALNSGTSALDLALRVLDLKEDDEVIVPAITFLSTAHVVFYNRAKLVLADVEPNTLNIDVEDVKRKITSRTKAIVAVHYSGRPVNFDALKLVAGNIPIIEDSAHATGATYKGRKCGSLGDISAFSFHAVKPLPIGDGGAITLNNKAQATRAKRLSWLGIDKTTWNRSHDGKLYAWEYFCDEIGFKYHMNDLQAALAIEQLKDVDYGVWARKQITEGYRNALRDVDEISFPPEDTIEYQSSWHIFCIRCKNRNELGEYLMKHGISTGVHYKPLHMFNCYNQTISLPNAESEFKQIMTLPLYVSLSFEDVKKISELIKRFYVQSASKVTVS